MTLHASAADVNYAKTTSWLSKNIQLGQVCVIWAKFAFVGPSSCWLGLVRISYDKLVSNGKNEII